MGQRLVINFYKDGKRIMNTYQHWNGYTRGAIITVAECLEALQNAGTRIDRSTVAKAICNSFNKNEMSIQSFIAAKYQVEDYTGAGMCGVDFDNEELRKEIGIPPCSDRNIGILSFSEAEMEDTDSWGEQHATINVDNLTACVEKTFWNLQDDADIFDDDEDVQVVDFPDYVDNLCKDYYDAAQLRELVETFNRNDEHYNYPRYKDKKGQVFCLVE